MRSAGQLRGERAARVRQPLPSTSARVYSSGGGSSWLTRRYFWTSVPEVGGWLKARLSAPGPYGPLSSSPSRPSQKGRETAWRTQAATELTMASPARKRTQATYCMGPPVRDGVFRLPAQGTYARLHRHFRSRQHACCGGITGEEDAHPWLPVQLRGALERVATDAPILTEEPGELLGRKGVSGFPQVAPLLEVWDGSLLGKISP